MSGKRIIYIHPGQQLHHCRPQDIVLPISQHPSIIEDSTQEKLPGEKGTAWKQNMAVTPNVMAIFSALLEGPATIMDVSLASGLSRITVENCLKINPHLFKKMDIKITGRDGYKRHLFALTDGAKTDKRILLAQASGAKRDKGDAVEIIARYLVQTGAAPVASIRAATGLSESGTYKLLCKHPHLFRQIDAPTTRAPRRVVWEYVGNGTSVQQH